MQRRTWNRFRASVNGLGSFPFKIDGWCEADESKSLMIGIFSIEFTTLFSLISYCGYSLT